MAKKTSTARRPAKPAAKARKPAKAPSRAKPAARKASPASGSAKARPSTATRDLALSFLAFSHKMITDMMNGVPESQATAQIAPANNHVLWTLGHLAMTNDWLATLIDAKPGRIPKSYEALFGMGSSPTGNMSNYPSLKDVRAEYDRAYDRLVSVTKARNDAELFEPPTGNSFGFTTNKLDGVLKAAWHEGWHIGQIADLRRGLGIKPMLGGSGS